MKIINKSGEFTRKEMYQMTKAESLSIKDYEGVVITPAKWIQYEDTNSEGQLRTILSIMDADGQIYSTVSETFSRTFFEMLEFMEGEEFQLEVTKGTSNKGRDYYSCRMI